MPPRRYPPRLVSRIALGAALLLALQATPTLLAADVTWSATGSSTAGGDGNWTGGSTWWNGSSAVSWTDGDNAFFTAAGNTTVNSSVAVNQIAFTNSADNISILGGAGDITLASGITARNTANTAALTFTISESIALGASQTWGVTNGGTTGTANLVVSGNISGTGYGITKTGNGTLTLSGNNNTYTGTTTISLGTLSLANTGANNKTIVGDILINGGALNFGAANQIADTASITMTSGSIAWNVADTIRSFSISGGSMNLTSSLNVTNSSTFTGGSLTVGARSLSATLSGPITLGNFTFSWGASASIASGITIGGNIAVNDSTTANFTGGGGRLTLNANRTIDVGTGANMNVEWGIVGTGYGITKNGTGTLTLSGANTYSGATTISAGTLQIGNGSTTGSIDSTSGVNNDATLAYNRSDNLSAAYAISGSGNVSKSGAGTLTLSGANSYSGGTLLDGGTLRGDTTSLQGAITNNAAAIFDTATNGTYAGVMSGVGTLAKSGAGTLTLTASNTYAGTTTVSEGTLAVNGSIDSATTVQSGATVAGTGSINSVTIASGGTISPGNSPGTLTITNGMTWDAGGNYNWQIFDVADSSKWDLVDVTGGTFTLNGLSELNKFNINLWSLSGIAPDTNGAVYNFNNTQAYSWRIVQSANPISGTFSNSYFSINTGAVNGTGGFANDLGGGLFSVAMDGNNLNLVFTPASSPIPEPGTWAAAALLAAAAGFLHLRKRRRKLGEVAAARAERPTETKLDGLNVGII